MKDFTYYKNRKYLSKKEEKNIINVYSKLFQIYNINNKKLNAIELGAGHGIKTIVLKELFKSVLATEPNEELYKLLQKKTEKFKNITTLKSTCENLLIKKKYDIAIFTYSFKWIKNKKKCLKNTTNYLNKNGYILIIENSSYYINELRNSDEINKIEEINIMNILSNTKNLNLIFFGIISSNMKDFIYLLQKK